MTILFWIIFLFIFFPLLLKIIFVKGMKLFLRKGYAEAAAVMRKRLSENESFLEFATEIVKKSKRIKYDTALNIFFDFPEMTNIARQVLRERRQEFKARGEVTMLIWEHIVETLADQFTKEWNQKDTKNELVLKIKLMIENNPNF